MVQNKNRCAQSDESSLIETKAQNQSIIIQTVYTKYPKESRNQGFHGSSDSPEFPSSYGSGEQRSETEGHKEKFSIPNAHIYYLLFDNGVPVGEHKPFVLREGEREGPPKRLFVYATLRAYWRLGHDI